MWRGAVRESIDVAGRGADRGQHLHAEDTLRKALDHLSDSKGCGLAALDRGVKHGAIGKLAGIVDLHI